ncbi:glycosyltransferase, partial [Sphingomonas fennica]
RRSPLAAAPVAWFCAAQWPVFAPPLTASGLPAIGFSRCPGVNELIVDGVNGFLAEESSASSLAKTLRRALEDEQRLAQLGKNAAEIAETYSVETSLQKWRQALEDLLNPQPNRLWGYLSQIWRRLNLFFPAFRTRA